MAQVHNAFSTYRLFASGPQAVAGLYVILAATVARLLAPRQLTCVGDLRDREYLPSRSREGPSPQLPGSLFDARYDGLAAHAARLDAAICRRMQLR